MDFSRMDKKKPMGDSEKKAKLTALKEAHKMASDAMREDLSGLKKITVASDSKEGLKKGIDKAEEILGEDDSEDSEMGEKADEQSEGYEDQQEESEPMDLEDLEAKIQELMALKEKMKK